MSTSVDTRFCMHAGCEEIATIAWHVVTGVELDTCRDHRHDTERRADELRPFLLDLRTDDGGGPRHYLDGKPIHCGDRLELEVDETVEDGPAALRWMAVRYEVRITGRPDRPRIPLLVFGYLSSGDQLICEAPRYARLRWPARPA